jgi:4-amino-4-deoxy-L-arabinose transferase-like glycosyltransferase
VPRWGIVLALFAAAVLARLLFAAQLAFPPLDDPAFYLQSARNLAQGRGLVIDVVWFYQVPFDSVTHPSHEYWMPLATLVMAPFLRLFGDHLLVARIPGILLGALLAPLTYWLGRKVWPDDPRRAVLASILVIGGALPIYQAASTDSAAPFAFCAAAALCCAGMAFESSVSRRWAFAAGVLGGLAYLARADGVLVVLCVVLFLAPSLKHRTGLAVHLAHLLGVGIVVLPWWWRNLAAFGAIQPASPSMGAVLQDYLQVFNWNDPPTLAGLLDRGIGFAASLRGQALQHNLSVWLVMGFPYLLLGIPGMLICGTRLMRLGTAYGFILLAVSAFVYSVPTMSGLFYHSAGATLPWLAVGCIEVLRRMHGSARWRLVSIASYAAMVILIGVQDIIALPNVNRVSREEKSRFEAAAEWLHDHVARATPVIASQPHNLNYVSGVPTLMLPAGQDVDRLREVAAAFGARIVVVTEKVGQYPEALDRLVSGGGARRSEADGALIYELSESFLSPSDRVQGNLPQGP